MVDIETIDDTAPAVSSVFEDTINWGKVTTEQLIQLISQRVIYNTEDIIAFDKPAGLPYSGSKSTRLQFDRVLQDVKKLVANETQRLLLVESLDRCASGVIYFAKTEERQKQLREAINEGKVTHRFRLVARGVPEAPTADINIPLRKVMNGRDIRWLPLLERTSDPISHEITRYKLINKDEPLGVSLLDVFVNKSSSVHQIRSHLALGINCPLIGESKYNPKKKNESIKLSPRLLEALELPPNSSKKVPMLIHLSEVLIPVGSGSRFSVIKASYPPTFMKVIKYLSLFKK